jgi:PadR family transcriptional regulator, regulatory protein PadR
MNRPLDALLDNLRRRGGASTPRRGGRKPFLALGCPREVPFPLSLQVSVFVASPSIDLLQGSLDVIVLQTLRWQPMHGFGIARWIQRVTDDVFQVEEGTLYPALYRMENKGWVKGEWRITENNRRAKYYRLTAAGKRRLAEEAKTWQLFAGAMTKIMNAVPSPA